MAEVAIGGRVGTERRDVAARVARDRLAHMLGLHPRTLGNIDGDLAQKMTRHLNVINRRMQHLVDSSAMDELTGVLRRATGLEALERELHRARRFGDQRLVVAFIDVDSLKSVNDSAGHAAGDQLIRDVADTLHSRLRAYDLVVRWGGDEFVCVLPEAGLKGAARILDEIAVDFSSATGHRFSVGFAEILANETAAEMVARADAALYSGRRQRRPLNPRRHRSDWRTAGMAAGLAILVAIAVGIGTAAPGSVLAGPRVQIQNLADSITGSR